MALFRKKKEELPAEEFTLPEPPSLEFPGLPNHFSEEHNGEISELPALPELPRRAKDEEKVVKREFEMPALPELPARMPELTATKTKGFLKPMRIEMGEELPTLPSLSSLPSFPEFPEQVPEMPELLPTAAGARRLKSSPVERPVFVKIEKFQDSVEQLRQIKERIRRASSMLDKLREIRMREEQELAAWERDLAELKQKLEMLDKKLFTDVE